MKPLQADPKATSQILFVLASLLLAGALVGLVNTSPPNPAQEAKRAKGNERKEERKAETARNDTNVAKASVLARTWIEEPGVMKGQVGTLTATLAKQRGLKWVRLTPPIKPTLTAGLEQYPFLLVVEGPFPAVALLERDLEQPANRLAVNSFQATASDNDTDVVTANIGLVAHRVAPVESVEKEKPNANRK